jgi:hypothetical protein
MELLQSISKVIFNEVTKLATEVEAEMQANILRVSTTNDDLFKDELKTLPELIDGMEPILGGRFDVSAFQIDDMEQRKLNNEQNDMKKSQNSSGWGKLSAIGGFFGK